jgi:hypothetical protein
MPDTVVNIKSEREREREKEKEREREREYFPNTYRPMIKIF